MNLPIKIKDRSFTLPSDWHSMSVLQFNRMAQWAMGDQKPVDMYSILTGAPVEWIAKLKGWQVDQFLDPHITFMNSVPVFDKPVPFTIEIDGKILTPPETLEKLSFGKYIELTRFLDTLNGLGLDDPSEHKKRMGIVILLIFWDEIYEDEFSMTKLEQRIDVINDLNYSECHALELFFWKGWRTYRRRGSNGWTRLLTQIKRQLALNDLKASGITGLLTLWPGVTLPSLKQS